MPKNARDKTCSVISPIRGEGTEACLNPEKVLEHLIEPAAVERGYKVIRSDKVRRSGTITNQMVRSRILDMECLNSPAAFRY